MPEDMNRRQVGPLLLDSLEYVWTRVRGPLEDLAAAEYLWEPVPDCWSVRPTRRMPGPVHVSEPRPVLHLQDKLSHHGAEIALPHDLYLRGFVRV
jgi:hypothetical protein